MELIENALNYVQSFFENEFSGHDYFHTLRVFKTATRIATAEQADLQIVQLAALLHDVDDRKLSPQTHASKANARRFLEENHGFAFVKICEKNRKKMLDKRVLSVYNKPRR